jgi:poly-gamma-glutamate capsule biosynthesis protein CapA/YwtB (metallophosphatase superfamily)
MIASLLTWMTLSAALAGNAAEDDLSAGMEAQRAGRIEAAIDHYGSCLTKDPARVECHWELGWSYWTRADWGAVVEHWETVDRLAPDHTEVDKWLPTARENLAQEQALQAELLSAPTTARPPLPPGKSIRLRLVGDIMIGTTSPHPTAHLPPDDGAHYFDAVKPLLTDADLTFGNLEGPLCDTTARAQKCSGDSPCYAFRQPTRYADLLADAGLDLVSIANNHMMDFEAECRDQTIAALDRVGLAWSGPPGTIATVERDGVRVAMIAFHTARHSNYINDHDNARRLVSLASRSHDLVIVSFHGGAEGSKALHVPDAMELFYGEKRGHLRRFARAVVDAGADLVVGHGPHVLRGMEVVDGRLVLYSLGNFGTYDRFNLSGHLGTTAVVEVELDHEGKLVRGKLLPVRQVGNGIPEVDPEGRSIALVRDLTRTDFPGTGPIIGQDGTFAPPAP